MRVLFCKLLATGYRANCAADLSIATPTREMVVWKEQERVSNATSAVVGRLACRAGILRPRPSPCSDNL